MKKPDKDKVSRLTLLTFFRVSTLCWVAMAVTGFVQGQVFVGILGTVNAVFYGMWWVISTTEEH